MKKRYGILLVLSFSIAIVSSCVKEKNANNEGIKEYCQKYVTDYKILEEKEKGEIVISVTAPDFNDIVEEIGNKGKEDIDIEVIEKSVKGNPDCEKEYVFSVSSEEKEAIEEKFYEKISEELMIDAIRKVEYREEWGVE